MKTKFFVTLLAMVTAAGAGYTAKTMLEIGPVATVTSNSTPEILFIDDGDGGNDASSHHGSPSNVWVPLQGEMQMDALTEIRLRGLMHTNLP